MAGLGDEGAPDLAPELGADRDVLQVRIAAAQASGGGHRLIEAGVDPAGLRIHQLRQRVDVGPFQLLQRPPFENQARQVVHQRQLLEHFDRRRGGAGLDVALERRQLQLVEQDPRQLLRRIDVERLAGELEDLVAADRQLTFDVLRLRRERGGIDAHAGALDRREHRNERPLEIAIDAVQPLGCEHRRQPVGQLQRQIGPLAGVGRAPRPAPPRRRRWPWRRVRRRPPRRAPCSRDVRARCLRADARTGWRRADSSPASCRRPVRRG